MTEASMITMAVCNTIDETVAFASSLAGFLRAGDILALEGDLGSGKTVFARAIVHALCGEEVEVPSPTFNLLLTYECQGTGIPLYHYDLYRLEQSEEVLELDIEDAFDEGISLIEWPGQMGSFLPPTALTVQIKTMPSANSREISLLGNPDWLARLSEFFGANHA
ncbi:MAG: tRNA (adenosine(37)-N6)-threonylcarbamoyltransferase complex ATPase subunit type 1 TsaE [Proteobacteria bacterium]|nr:tRNA (adenosine(37)-N6)-threonylcarbamoyltransferase complex ATPase subunit type 1 TsaE [Pseudomonadota bacterium]